MNFLLKTILLFITTVWFTNITQGQTPVFKHYTIEDGLPSAEVYSAFQDSKGYIWFATDNGVSRFNGYEFTNFNTNNGLTDNTVFLITEDSKGRVWFGTFNLQLSYFENDSIYPYRYNKLIADSIEASEAMKSFHVDEADNVWIGCQLIRGILKISKRGILTQYISTPSQPKTGNIRVLNNGIWGLKRNKALHGPNRTNINIQSNKKSINFQYKLKIDIKKNHPWSFHCYSKDGQTTIVSTDKIIYHNNTTTPPIEIPFVKKQAINSVNIIDGFLWFCTRDNGTYKCKILENKLIIHDHYFKNKAISRVFKDRENGFWFLSLNDGVYYMSSDQIKHLKLSSNPVTALEVDTNSRTLYTAYLDGQISKQQITNKRVPIDTILKSFLMLNTLKYDYFNDSLRYSYSLPNHDKSSYTLYERFIPSAILIDSNYIYQCDNRELQIVKNKLLLFSSAKEGYPKIRHTSLIKNDDKIWIGTKDGIRVYKDRKITSPFKNNKYLSSAITSMERLNNTILLIGTKNYGLLIMKNNSIIDIINKEKGLINNLVQKIHVDNDKTIWVGTNNGLNKIKYQTPSKYNIFSITPKHGLISGDITAIKSYKNTIFVATPKGLIKFDKTKVKTNYIPPPVYITQFLVNSNSKTVKEGHQLTYKDNFIKLHYEGLNYRSLGAVEYKYRMLGVDTNWTSTTLKFVQYPTLQPNDYIFEIKAKNEDNIWSKPATISFTINSPFWLTWWFIASEIGLGVLILFLIFKYRENQLIKKGNIEKKMIELELKALRSQMNPHFIFNTLNSIQHFITLSDFRNTNKYIAQFAKLIRTVLNLSEKNTIIIQEEIDMLTLYMELEKMRFEEQFNYQIIIDPQVDPDYDTIPSMLIQPYVENAIWHGLMNKNKKGNIIIKISIEDNYLYCSIEDNGIGRKKAAEIKKKRNINHKSVGMSITKERLDFFNTEKDVNINTVDLVDSEGQALGTKITIKTPYTA